ncbi:SHOCT domain-containing protein [Gordonia sp. ABSL1-1]|uniref:SHOCT domain-containing protein n=1 Tax=Gordonia sp. ABSL1-1 TaxID=3053923 RepID=UPI0025739999|nr:SHOCT domain-containing protein [Gordonia sp. ABSL1-1]MDL9937878.1 SHOCT domain-containing protein [Gordonia sp. ABSL1-1]
MTMFGETGAGPQIPRGVWRFLGTFLFVMVCGIVGPIFLVMYFVIDEPDTGWLLWTGLLVTGIDVVLGVLLGWGAARGGGGVGLLSGGGDGARHRGVWRAAVADVLSISQTSIEINDQPLMKLGLRIHGDGIDTFDTETRTVVPVFQQALLHSRRLAVLVDPTSQKFDIDWQATALLAGSVPARFTSSEDGRDYDLTGQVEPLTKILAILNDHDVDISGTIDLRANPVARDAVMEVVREYAGTSADDVSASSATPPATAGAEAAPRTTAQRLADLADLRDRGAITGDEYEAARQRIIASI